MPAYLLKRLLRLPLSLLLLSLFCFGLFQLTPTDPVENYLALTEGFRGDGRDPLAYEKAYTGTARKLGFDLPAFYFSVTSAAHPTELDRIVDPAQRRAAARLLAETGNWSAVETWHLALREVAYHQPSATPDAIAVARRMLIQDDPQRLRYAVKEINDSPEGRMLEAQLSAVLEVDRSRGQLLIPSLRWHGTHNRYHRWLTGLLGGELGLSYKDNRPVGEKLGAALRVTALLNFLAIIVVFAVALPLGLYTAQKQGSWFDHITSLLLFLLFGIPSFWVATMVTNFFTTPAFGMDFFPSMGLGDLGADAGAMEVLKVRAQHLFLPVLCLAYPSWAYVARHLRRSTIGELEKPYVSTAAMKGLSEGQVLWKHVFRNASFPIITLVGNLLPALLVGSILIERIFNLPGMGQLLFEAANTRDWPVIIALVLLNGLFTALGLLMADVGYALADPRVSLER